MKVKRNSLKFCIISKTKIRMEKCNFAWPEKNIYQSSVNLNLLKNKINLGKEVLKKSVFD